jgi:enoyl-[acyl-carrier-protein] reductase (NADH)
MTLLQKTVPLLAKRPGSTFITCTSIGSRAVLPTYALVGVAKAAMESMVRYGAAEAGPQGVTVNALSTAPIPTKALSAFPVTDQWLNDSAKRTPLGRLLTPEEVADVAFFLTGPAARVITGQVIIVDGGWEILAPLSA